MRLLTHDLGSVQQPGILSVDTVAGPVRLYFQMYSCFTGINTSQRGLLSPAHQVSARLLLQGFHSSAQTLFDVLCLDFAHLQWLSPRFSPLWLSPLFPTPHRLRCAPTAPMSATQLAAPSFRYGLLSAHRRSNLDTAYTSQLVNDLQNTLFQGQCGEDGGCPSVEPSWTYTNFLSRSPRVYPADFPYASFKSFTTI